MNYDQRLRKTVIELYGGFCVCCGETNYKFLTVEHKKGGGTQHKNAVGGWRAMYRNLKTQYDSDIEIRCWNCNCAKGRFGICPHEEALNALVPQLV